MPPAPADRPLDLVVFGATSFVGRLLCAHLVARHGSDGDLRWAMAGRRAEGLAAVAEEVGADVEHLVADATDAEALADLVGRTRVVASTVGPYALHGSALVAAAAAAGTDYCDLAGEPQWVRRMIDAHQDEAEATGARLVPSCGFDSIPSDLGVWFTQQQAEAALGAPCTRIAMRVEALRGGASGGTIASMVNVVEEAAHDRSLRRLLADPYALVPDDAPAGVRQTEVTVPRRDAPSGQWVAPFVMAATNTKVVHRSHALLGRPWGDGFRYDEAMAMGTGAMGAVKASGLAAGMAGGMGVLSVGPLRRLLGERVLPQPGTGPSPEAQAAGSFDLRFFGETATGARIRTRVTGDRDPGYGSTARMVGEAAVALVALDGDDVGGGFLTPATAFGDDLVERLTRHAGLGFSVLT